MLDEVFIAEVRADTIKVGKSGGVCSLAMCSQLSLLSRIMEGL